MFRSIWEDIQREYRYGNMVTRLVLINLAIFFVVNLLWAILGGPPPAPPLTTYHEVINFFAIPSDWKYLLMHPWSVITHMFLHEGFLHVVFNMLFLYWFGRIVGDFIGDHRVLPLYLLAGLASAFSFFVSSYFIPSGDFAIGASGAVMGFVVAAALIAPDYNIRLLFFGNVPLKYIAVGLVVVDVMAISMGQQNTGGHFGHLGGAVFGWVFVRQLQMGNDLSGPVNQFIQRVRDFFRGLGQDTKKSRKRRGPKVAYRNPDKTKTRTSRQAGSGRKEVDHSSHQEQLDAILDKIKENGYESLTQQEKEFLFNASKE